MAFPRSWEANGQRHKSHRQWWRSYRDGDIGGKTESFWSNIVDCGGWEKATRFSERVSQIMNEKSSISHEFPLKYSTSWATSKQGDFVSGLVNWEALKCEQLKAFDRLSPSKSSPMCEEISNRCWWFSEELKSKSGGCQCVKMKIKPTLSPFLLQPPHFFPPFLNFQAEWALEKGFAEARTDYLMDNSSIRSWRCWRPERNSIMNDRPSAQPHRRNRTKAGGIFILKT